MKNNIQISIPNPCSENWNEMQANSCGRFCNSCQKTVTDFTRMNDEAFIAYFQNTKTVSCGRFTDRQLAIAIPAKASSLLPFWKMSKYVAASMIAAAGLSGKAFGQKVEVEQLSNSFDEVIRKEAIKSSNEVEVIRGRVTDYYNEGDPLAKIVVKDLDIQTTTDVDGYFELRIKRDPKIVYYKLQVLSSVNYVWQTAIVNIYTHPPITIIRLPEKITLTAMVGGVSIYRPTKWNRFKKWIKTNFL